MTDSARNGADEAVHRERTGARRGLAAAVAAVRAAFLAALCCGGPFLLVAFGFNVLYGERSAAACAPSDACACPVLVGATGCSSGSPRSSRWRCSHFRAGLYCSSDRSPRCAGRLFCRSPDPHLPDGEFPMNKSLATFGILAVTGVLWVCDLCGSSARVATGADAREPAAVLAPVSAAVPRQTRRRVTPILAVRYTATRPR